MPTIEISPGWLCAEERIEISAGSNDYYMGGGALFFFPYNVSSTQIKYNTPLFSTYTSTSNQYSLGVRDQVLQIFQSGIDGVPTDFSGLTAKTSRSDDLLIEYSNYYNTTQEVIIEEVFGRTAVPAYISARLTTNLKAATQSGTATWFRWYGYQTSGTSTTPAFHQFIGTVGAEGSGADLEFSSTSIVSGTQYRVIRLEFKMTGVWTYT